MNGILFDWDGTLVDSKGGLLAAYRHATSVVLGQSVPTTDADADELLEMGDHEALRMLSGQPGLLEQLSERFRTAYGATHNGAVHLYPAAHELVVTLRERGWVIGVLSNGDRRRVQDDLERFELLPLVDVWITGQDTDSWVPHPAPVRLALDRMGVVPQDGLFVGDRPADIVAGRTAGTHTVAVLRGDVEQLHQEHPDFAVASLDGIVDVVDQLDGNREAQA